MRRVARVRRIPPSKSKAADTVPAGGRELVAGLNLTLHNEDGKFVGGTSPSTIIAVDLYIFEKILQAGATSKTKGKMKRQAYFFLAS